MGKPTICISENKDADQLIVVTAKLISAFVFATRIVQFLFYLNLKFQASSSFLCWLVSDLFGNHIVGFPTRWLKYSWELMYLPLGHNNVLPAGIKASSQFRCSNTMPLHSFNKLNIDLKPEDQWSCKRSPESGAYTNKHV